MESNLVNVEIYNKLENSDIEVGDTIYSVAKNTNTILSVLTFTIIIIFLYKFIKSKFSFRK